MLKSAADYLVFDLFRLVVGIGIGAFIHGYVPQNFLARWAGRDNPFAVPAAVALGVPLSSNAAGVIPIVQELTAKGMAVGTVLATFFGIVATAIVIVGYLFNAVL